MSQAPAIVVKNEPRTVPRSERVVFAPSVEALLIRGLGKQVTPELTAQLRALGIDLAKPLLPGYGSKLWQDAIELVARKLYPHLPMGQAQWRLGESTVRGFEETMVGRAMVALSKVIGPRRALLRFPSMSRTSNNFAHMTGEEISPTEIRFVLEPYEGLPEYVQGCLSAVITVTGGKEPKVDVISQDPATERVVMRATWKP